MVEITPEIGPLTDVMTLDVDGNGEFEPFEGDVFEDRNGNGVFDGEWIAGFGNGRPASGVRDPQWARVLVLRNGDTTLAFASVDLVGYFFDEVVLIREALADTEIDFLSVSATHSHEARDTVGIWGVDLSTTGVSLEYNARVRDAIEEAARAALLDLRLANIQYASLRLRDQPGGMLRYVSDAREPWIIDDEVRLLRFLEAGDGPTIATLVNWGSHPEYMGSSNTELSSDFAHYLRQAIEDGVTGPDGAIEPGLGGMAIYFNGAVGSQIGPIGTQQSSWAGDPIPRNTLESAQAAGEQVGYFALRALGPGGGATTDAAAALSFRRRELLAKIQNRGYHVAVLQGLFVRSTYEWDPGGLLRPGVNEPSLLTEISVVDIGRAQILSVPGEIDPSLWVGGYDGSYTPAGVEIVDTSLLNPPDLASAPAAPYLIDRMRSDAEMKMLFGLTNDEIGYFVPAYDYELDPRMPYLEEAPGDHYEETNSIGVDGWPTIEAQIHALLAWTP